MYFFFRINLYCEYEDIISGYYCFGDCVWAVLDVKESYLEAIDNADDSESVFL